MGKLFGTDGIRGEANRHPMDAAMAFAVGQAVNNLVVVPFLEQREKNHFIRVDPPEWQQALEILDANTIRAIEASVYSAGYPAGAGAVLLVEIDGFEAGLDDLLDLPRSGRPPEITPETRLAVVALATSAPPDGSTRWSTRRLAKEAGIGASSVHSILHEAELQPHRTRYWCGRSPDPEFATKQAAVLGLYLDPPLGALVICVDEKSQIQALDRTQPELPMRPGSPRRLSATYKRHGTVCLLAALSVHTGEIAGRCVDKNDHVTFLRFLKSLYRAHPRTELHVILDNHSAHTQKDVMAWAARRRRLTLHFTPTYASWLNQVEIWFNIFARDVLKDAVWHSKAELVKQIMAYIRSYTSTRAKPFRWTYTGKPLTA